MKKAPLNVKLGSEVMVPGIAASYYGSLRCCANVPGTVLKTAYSNTRVLALVTCRACKFGLLSDTAPWARAFLDDLRKQGLGKAEYDLRKQGLDKALLAGTVSPGVYVAEFAGPRQPDPITVPGTTAEPVDGIVERPSARLGRPFTQQAGSKKAIGELLPEAAPVIGTIQPVMERSGAPADTIGVQPGKVAEDTGNAGQISDEAWGHY